MAKVYVNDRYAGGAWCPPYKVDITQCVKKGRNTLRVEVVNKCVNRIVGDMQLPPEQRKISLLVNPYDASTPLPPSGLQQAVTVETYANGARDTSPTEKADFPARKSASI